MSREPWSRSFETSDTQRTVVVLHDIEGFQYQEIAEIVGTSIGTVRSPSLWAGQIEGITGALFFITTCPQYPGDCWASNDFNCDQLEPFLSAYHDGEFAGGRACCSGEDLNGCTGARIVYLKLPLPCEFPKPLPRLNPKLM